jgi:ABC-type branched-subunit amino acid transport system substrate-binding protein
MNLDPKQLRTLQTVVGIAVVAMLSVSLAAISVVRADQADGELVAVGGSGDGGFSTGTGGTTGGSQTGGAGTVPGAAGDGMPGQDPSGGGGGAQPGQEAQGGGGQPGEEGGEATGPGGQANQGGGGGGGGGCTDANPNEGVYCDRWLVGGTTILSGPLAIYGEQGLKGGQAWIEYFRRTLAPELGVRPSQLIYYDDNLEPRRTLQFVQKLVEEDKVLLIGGVTNPGAVAGYLEEQGVAFIGDLGLNPGSYESSSIFPTSAPFEVSFQLRARTAKRNGAKSISVIQDVLPASDPAVFKRLWEQAAQREGLRLLSFQPIDSQANTCDSRMLNVIREQPDWVMLPVAAAPMLGCMREAASQQYKPGAVTAGNLINWSGGSNLAFEVEQCGSQCFGMFSGGTPFLDPRTNPSPQAKAYLDNMARYAPGIDVTGFIAINYYHAGLLQFEVMREGGILQDLSRANVLKAAEGFGPFETGFGNTVHWEAGKVPRVPTTCGYEVILDPEKRQWVFQTEKLCL